MATNTDDIFRGNSLETTRDSPEQSELDAETYWQDAADLIYVPERPVGFEFDPLIDWGDTEETDSSIEPTASARDSTANRGTQTAGEAHSASDSQTCSEDREDSGSPQDSSSTPELDTASGNVKLPECLEILRQQDWQIEARLPIEGKARMKKVTFELPPKDPENQMSPRIQIPKQGRLEAADPNRAQEIRRRLGKNAQVQEYADSMYLGKEDFDLHEETGILYVLRPPKQPIKKTPASVPALGPAPRQQDTSGAPGLGQAGLIVLLAIPIALLISTAWVWLEAYLNHS